MTPDLASFLLGGLCCGALPLLSLLALVLLVGNAVGPAGWGKK